MTQGGSSTPKRTAEPTKLTNSEQEKVTTNGQNNTTELYHGSLTERFRTISSYRALRRLRVSADCENAS